MQKNYKTSRDELTQNKGDEIDSKRKLDYRDNLNEPVKEKTKLSDRKRKESPWVVKKIELSRYLIVLKKENVVVPSVYSIEVYKMIKEDYQVAIYASLTHTHTHNPIT